MGSYFRFFAIRCFSLLCLLWYVNVAHGQQLTLAPAQDTSLNWLSAVAAKTQIQTKLGGLHAALPGQTPGTQAHTDLLRQILFYKAVLRAVAMELPLAQAIGDALPEAASLGGLQEQALTPEATLRALYAEAVDLLTN